MFESSKHKNKESILGNAIIYDLFDSYYDSCFDLANYINKFSSMFRMKMIKGIITHPLHPILRIPIGIRPFKGKKEKILDDLMERYTSKCKYIKN